jgi:hypothetical protein
MWTIETSSITNVEKEKIWNLWIDVNKWNVWDEEVEHAEILGSFEKGAKGILKPKNGPKTNFEIVECQNFKSFTTRSVLPFCQMDFIHQLNEKENQLEISHRVEMTGFMTFLFSKIIGENIKNGLPKAVETLVKLAEKSN